MGLCSTRRVFLLFLTITVLQIIFTGARQIFDFLGPLWSLIITNFLNIVFSIFGFFGGYTRRKHYLISYVIWSVIWIGWNLFIICLYIPIPNLEIYKSQILSLGTGGFSWWETRAPGCIPDWRSETQLHITNCMLDPRLMEIVIAGIQIYLSFIGVICSLSLILCQKLYDQSDKDSKNSAQNPNGGNSSVPSFLSLSRQNVSSHSRASNRLYNRAPIALPGANGGDSSDQQISGNTLDDRLRPMTPRRVKRRSARSIQSQRFGPSTSKQGNHPQDNGDKPSTSRGSSGGSGRSSLRSNASRRGTHNRNSKRKTNHHFVSPVNRLMQQQQLDSETSHDEPRRYLLRDQGHANPAYSGPQSPKYGGHAPPRPPSARSSYSNYHPARMPLNANPSDLLPNVINLNQNIFTNGGFDMSTEYNMSQHSNNTSTALYEDEINLHPNLNSPVISNPPMIPNLPNGISLSFKPQNTHYQQQNQQQLQPPPRSFPRLENGGIGMPNNPNPVFAYPLAHSPVSQESFPMWGVSQPQSPISNRIPLSPRSPPYQNRPVLQLKSNLHGQPLNSETVI